MIQYLNKLEQDRRLLLAMTNNLTVDQYNVIPPGFNNNIIWNMGHILVVSESLLYQNSAYERPVHELMRSNFEMGSVPDEMVGEEEISIIRHSLEQTVQLYKKSAGIDRPGDEFASGRASGSIATSNERMPFLLFHEEMHYRRIAQLLNIVKK